MSTANRVYVGVDFGDRRIGLAKSDPLGLMASPVRTHERRGHSADISSILTFASECGALEIVVGMPTSMSGQAGPQARRTAEFAESLAARAPIPVRTQDERLSSVEARAMLREAGKIPSRDRAAVDAAAAAIILQRFLDGMNAASDRSGDPSVD